MMKRCQPDLERGAQRVDAHARTLPCLVHVRLCSTHPWLMSVAFECHAQVAIGSSIRTGTLKPLTTFVLGAYVCINALHLGHMLTCASTRCTYGTCTPSTLRTFWNEAAPLSRVLFSATGFIMASERQRSTLTEMHARQHTCTVHKSMKATQCFTCLRLACTRCVTHGCRNNVRTCSCRRVHFCLCRHRMHLQIALWCACL